VGDWLCRSELMKCPTLLLVAPSEILNFWNFAVRRVYMPTDIYTFLSLFYRYVHVYAHDCTLKKLVQLQIHCEIVEKNIVSINTTFARDIPAEFSIIPQLFCNYLVSLYEICCYYSHEKCIKKTSSSKLVYR
jgi:hypothetical protein